MNPADQCRRIVNLIAEATGEEWTFGYIGNCGPGYDDRSWSAFRPHPGRIGTASDRIGGYPTAELDKLAPILQGALQMARMLKS